MFSSDVLASFWPQKACPVTRERLSGGHYRQPNRLLYRRRRGEPHLRLEGDELLPGRPQLWRTLCARGAHAWHKDRVNVERFVAGDGVARGSSVGWWRSVSVPSPSPRTTCTPTSWCPPWWKRRWRASITPCRRCTRPSYSRRASGARCIVGQCGLVLWYNW